MVKGRKELFLLLAKRLLLFLMVAVFSGMPVLEMHHHHSEGLELRPDGHDKLSTNHVKCNVCQLLNKHQPIPLIPITSVFLGDPDAARLRFEAIADEGLFSLPIVGRINRGPPALA
ncbi:hypothetical protein DBR43_10850 [Pedobacter sp. KBW06]|uniref:hypothetical protein n=1 Tax=Pedobacter sp. KBW06 TaxID=2153359 RepID=UPI000F5A488E|nr:hypothetical protein [Pedobacter sp. KBW06]RQO71740.1 hypothetical protein DBR43_10850 [Pedobacter sp. KBW06]